MNKIKNIIIQHRMAALGVLFLLVIFIGGSIVSATNVAQRRTQENIAQTNQSSEQGQSANLPAAEIEEGGVSLTDSQRAAIESYDDDIRAFIDTLSASVWSANNGQRTLRFSDDQYTETVNGEVATHGYAILRLEKSSDDAGAEHVTAIFETDTGTHIVDYENLTGSANDGSGAVTSTLSSTSMFSLPDTLYTRSDTVQSVTVKGLNSEVTQLIGGSSDELTTELSSWCVVHYPTVTEAAWDGTAFIDYASGTVTLSFTLNNESPVNLSVTYYNESGTFAFSF